MNDAAPSLRSRVSLDIAPLREATEVIVRNHYLHRGRTMAQVAYWIELDHRRCGVILFALPRLSVPFRGFHPMTLIELARLWTDPEVQEQRVTDRRGSEHTMAVTGCAVAAALRRIRTDWYQKYPHLPEIEACVAWADQVRHRGTVYRATNFTEVGTSGGKQPGRWQRPDGGSHRRHPDYNNPKTAFLYLWDGDLDAKRTDLPTSGMSA